MEKPVGSWYQTHPAGNAVRTPSECVGLDFGELVDFGVGWVSAVWRAAGAAGRWLPEADRPAGDWANASGIATAPATTATPTTAIASQRGRCQRDASQRGFGRMRGEPSPDDRRGGDGCPGTSSSLSAMAGSAEGSGESGGMSSDIGEVGSSSGVLAERPGSAMG